MRSPSIFELVAATEAAYQAHYEPPGAAENFDAPTSGPSVDALHACLKDVREHVPTSATALLVKLRHLYSYAAELDCDPAFEWIERDLLALASAELLATFADDPDARAAAESALAAGMGPTSLIGVLHWVRDADAATLPRLHFDIGDGETAMFSPQGRL